MQLTDFGVRAGWLRGGRSWHWDELKRIEGAHAVTRSGESLRIAASQRAEVAAVLDGPLLQGTVTDRAASLLGWF